MQRMGGMSGVLGMLPGMGKMKKQASAMAMDDRALLQQAAIVSSMTQAEKDNPKLLNASRKKRIAAGSGTSVQEINKLIKMHRQMADMMKKLGKGGMKGLAGMMGLGGAGGPAGMGGMGGPAGMGGMPDMNQLPDMNKLQSGQDTPDFLKGLGIPPKKK
jgi:signal recognition particle subunit SRP54